MLKLFMILHDVFTESHGYLQETSWNKAIERNLLKTIGKVLIFLIIKIRKSTGFYFLRKINVVVVLLLIREQEILSANLVNLENNRSTVLCFA